MADVAVRDEAVSLIDGEPSTTPGRRIPVTNAYTLETLGEVVEAGETVVDHAVSAARAAFGEWSAREVTERAEILRAAADVVAERGERIAELVTAEMGMPITLSRVSQGQLPAAVLRTAADRATEFAWHQDIEGATLHRRPSGVVAAISPWNMPAYQIVAKVAGALVAGCTVIVKPSEQTPFDGELLVRLLHDGGVPAGAVQLVQGSGPVTGSALARHPGVNHVSFTGSVEAAGGRFLSGHAAREEAYGPGFFVAPTVIAGLDARAEAVQEEIFGPVLVTQPYRDIDDAVRVAGDTRFGLSAEVWGPADEAVAVAGRLHVGQVKINGVRTRERPGVPFGGVDESGYGRELGALGIEEFTYVTAVLA